MSHKIEQLKCPVCHGTRINLDVIKGAVQCDICGFKGQESMQGISYGDNSSWDYGSFLTSGTVQPKIIAFEEITRKTTQMAFPHTHDEFAKIQQELDELRKQIREATVLSTKIVVLEEVPKTRATEMIENYFKEHGSADIEELMLNLRIPVKTIVEIIDELKQKGKLVTED